jgi:hypothetical protein
MLGIDMRRANKNSEPRQRKKFPAQFDAHMSIAPLIWIKKVVSRFRV